ncbi:hypothetical protein Micbo1qcDRAFT_155805 [Microdochium bolleyi]|uniref:Uncharacterized protein n=1 Tax=Microdochium bolleyi TaxID=196109 RepID=A0A136JIS7_9PEZI|nr:hypothetical protein Micbo1qcDRAFT_155805 [Microdochium bolleyi]
MRSAVSIARFLPRIVTTAALFTATTPQPAHSLATHSYLHSTAGVMASSFTLQQKKISDGSFAILKDLVQSGDAPPRSAAQKAASAADAAINKANDKEPVDDGYLFQFWGDVFRAAEQAPSSDHPVLDKLVLFVRELSLQGNAEIKVWEKRIWKDLPVLGPALREKLDVPGESRDDKEQDKLNVEWVNFHAFAARLMAANVTDLSTHALWMLRDALEQELEAGSKEANREVLTATVWIEYAGPLLFEKVLWNPNPTLGDEDKRMLKAGPLYKGGPGLSSDRWLFWMKRFEEVAGKAVDGEAKAAALRTAKLMEVWAETRMKLPQ